MSITKRKNAYEVDVYINGKRVAYKYGFPTKAQARKWEEEVRTKYRNDPETAKSKDPTFLDLLEKYRSLHLPKTRITTQERYEFDIKLRIIPEFKYMKLKNISSEMILNFQAKLLKSMKPKSVNNCVGVLNSILNFGVKIKMLQANPCNIDPFKISVRDYSWWDKEADVKKFLDATAELKFSRPDRYAAAYRLALETGMRLAEIVGLSKQDIDFDRCTIRVHRQWLSQQKTYAPTKTNKIRTIGFDPDSDLVWLLKDAISRSDHPEAIFIGDNGQRVYDGNLSGRNFQGWIEKLGLPRITFHDMRHTFASWFMIRCGSIWHLMEILGHSDIKTTMKYAHLSSDVKVVPKLSGITENSRKNNFLKLVTT